MDQKIDHCLFYMTFFGMIHLRKMLMHVEEESVLEGGLLVLDEFLVQCLFDVYLDLSA